MKKIIKDKNGEIVVMPIIFMLIIMTSFIVLSFMPVFIQQQKLDIYASKLIRSAEIEGTIKQNRTIENLNEIFKIEPKITWEYKGYKGTKDVQLNDTIRVHLELKTSIKIIFHKLDFVLKSKATGKSEVYYK